MDHSTTPRLIRTTRLDRLDSISIQSIRIEILETISDVSKCLERLKDIDRRLLHYQAINEPVAQTWPNGI